MRNEIALDKIHNDKTEINTRKKLLQIGNESLFYFGIFLTALFLLHLIPYTAGILENVKIGINEVVVSFLGFANIFFLNVYYKIFNK